MLVMYIMKTFHITAPHIHDMNICHDMTSHTYVHANHNEETGKQVIIMNHMWLVCILASCLMLEGII